MVRRRAVLCVLGLLIVAPPVWAGGELFGGYSLFRRSGDDHRHAQGWNAAVGWDLRGPLAVALDVSSHYGSSNGTTDGQLTVALGPSLRLARRSRVRPFLHVLVGLARTSSGIKVFDVSISESHTGPGGLAGGGVDVQVGERWALRALQAELLVRRAEGATEKGLRLSAGAVYRFGRR